MRIAMFTNNYKPYIGGVPVSIEHLADALRKRGHLVYVFAPSYEGQLEEEGVIRYPSFPVKIAEAPIPNVLTKLFLKKMLELRIDIIHVHHPAMVGNVALQMRRKLGVPVVFTYHTRYEEYLHYVKALEKIEHKTRVIDWYLTHFCNRCDMLIAPTPGIRKDLHTKNIDTPVGIMPTGIPDKNYHPDSRKAKEIKRKYIGNADYLFSTVSRLAKEKNLDFQLEGLLELKKQLAQKGKTFRHMMIGSGPQKEAILYRAAELGLTENIILTGNVPNQEISNYQAAADLFLFTSKSETQGIVLLEAMAVEKPIVAVDATGVRDIIKDGVNGFMTEENAAVWAGKINGILENNILYHSMGQEAKKTALTYSESAVAEQAEIYYLNTCIRHPERPQNASLFRKYVVS